MAIDPTVVIIWLVIGAIAGWLSSQFAMGGGLGLVWDLIVGIVGAVIAGKIEGDSHWDEWQHFKRWI